MAAAYCDENEFYTLSNNLLPKCPARTSDGLILTAIINININLVTGVYEM